jgi:hypothetical protein
MNFPPSPVGINAVECIKTALLLNGGAAIALMTFANANGFSFSLIWPPN